MSTDGNTRKAEIEYLIQTDNRRDWRDEALQREYRDLLEREMGERPASRQEMHNEQESPRPVLVVQNAPGAETAKANAPRSHREDEIDRLPAIKGIVEQEAKLAGVNPRWLKAFASIESSGRPGQITGNYKGLFQLSDQEFDRFGPPGGNILDPRDNTKAAINSLKSRIHRFWNVQGREPTITELYLSHQQGNGGIDAHIRNPDQLAWVTMRNTGEGKMIARGGQEFPRKSGHTGPDVADKWAREAVWGNVPSDMRQRFPNKVDSVTSRQLMDTWREKTEGGADFGRFEDISQQERARRAREEWYPEQPRYEKPRWPRNQPTITKGATTGAYGPPVDIDSRPAQLNQEIWTSAPEWLDGNAQDRVPQGQKVAPAIAGPTLDQTGEPKDLYSDAMRSALEKLFRWR